MRTLIVGDVHGCLSELEELLAATAFIPQADRLVFVGDVVVRGPDPRGTLQLARRLGGTIVRGNHEQRLLAGRAGAVALAPDHRRVADILSEDEWLMLAATPLWLDLPEHGVRVVHAGVVPGLDIEQTPSQALLKIRTLDAQGGWSDARDGGDLWAKSYVGPPHVVFGHNARDEPQFHSWATGIDTGCVYGRRLTALRLEERELVPRGEAVGAKLISVPVRRSFAE